MIAADTQGNSPRGFIRRVCLWRFTRSVGLLRVISVDRMSYKDANANQNQNCRDCFNHLDEPRYTTGKVCSRPLFHDRFINPT